MRALTYPEAMDAAFRLLSFIREIPEASNAGPGVEAMQRSTGHGPGTFWCACGLYYVGSGLYGADWPLPRTASCDELYKFAKAKSWLVDRPAAGDVFLVRPRKPDPKNPSEHVGYVRKAFADGSFLTWECNAADPKRTASRNGTGVFSRTRGTHADTARYDFIRLP